MSVQDDILSNSSAASSDEEFDEDDRQRIDELKKHIKKLEEIKRDYFYQIHYITLYCDKKIAEYKHVLGTMEHSKKSLPKYLKKRYFPKPKKFPTEETLLTKFQNEGCLTPELLHEMQSLLRMPRATQNALAMKIIDVKSVLHELDECSKFDNKYLKPNTGKE